VTPAAESPLAAQLSERAQRAGAAYAGPGAGHDVPQGDRPPIAFTGGLPDPGLLPAERLAEATADVLRTDGNDALQYGGAQGWAGLREWLAERWSAKDAVALTPSHFTLTNGSAGALANVCETFVDPTDIVGVEAFSFPGSVRAIRSFTPRIECLPLDDDGLDVDALEALLRDLERRGERMRLLYTIATFHNPTGSTLSVARRQRLIDLCTRHDVLIAEDDAYGELFFGDEPPPSLYSLAGGKGVVKLGSFSKIVAPGLRVGWSQAEPAVVDALVATRSDLGTSPLLIRVLSRFLAEGFEEHLAGLRHAYAGKCRSMLDALGEHCAGTATWNQPGGGFFVWVTLREHVTPDALADACPAEGVSFVGGHVFSSERIAGDGRRMAWGPGDSRFLRLAFSYVAGDTIPEGILRLGAVLSRAAQMPQSMAPLS